MTKRTNCCRSKNDSCVYLGNIGDWNTSSVENMNLMFYDCQSLKSLGDIGDWNTSSVEDMSYMFAPLPPPLAVTSLESLGNIGDWNTSSVTNMDAMFKDCTNLLVPFDYFMPSQSDWDTTEVTSYSDFATDTSPSLCTAMGNAPALFQPTIQAWGCP
jgi:surface protein